MVFFLDVFLGHFSRLQLQKRATSTGRYLINTTWIIFLGRYFFKIFFFSFYTCSRSVWWTSTMWAEWKNRKREKKSSETLAIAPDSPITNKNRVWYIYRTRFRTDRPRSCLVRTYLHVLYRIRLSKNSPYEDRKKRLKRDQNLCRYEQPITALLARTRKIINH